MTNAKTTKNSPRLKKFQPKYNFGLKHALDIGLHHIVSSNRWAPGTGFIPWLNGVPNTDYNIIWSLIKKPYGIPYWLWKMLNQLLLKNKNVYSQTPLHGHLLNPLSPNIHIQILDTDFHTFPLRISWENLIKDQGIFSLLIILLILITISLDNLWISLGENWCWSLLGLKGLIQTPLYYGQFALSLGKEGRNIFSKFNLLNKDTLLVLNGHFLWPPQRPI